MLRKILLFVNVVDNFGKLAYIKHFIANNKSKIKAMGIKVEFNPDLALRDMAEYKKGKYKVIEVFKDSDIKFEGLWRTGVLKY